MSRRWNGIAATCSRQNSLVSITIVKPRYDSPRPSSVRIDSAVSRVNSRVSGFDLSSELQKLCTVERTRSRSSRVSGTALNAAVFNFGGLVGGRSLCVSKATAVDTISVPWQDKQRAVEE